MAIASGKQSVCFGSGLRWFNAAPCAETAPGPGRPLPQHNPHKNLLLFIKYYDARAKQLRYVTQLVLHRTHMLDDIMDEVRVV